MERRYLGELFEVSALTLGGGGIAQIWGPTSRSEAVATVRAAYDAGITLFDVAPLYGDGESESVLGEAFAAGYPDDVRVLTKCMLGPDDAPQALERLNESLRTSLKRLRRNDVSILLLHDVIAPDDFEASGRLPIRLSTYVEHVHPALVDLARSGQVGAWGISALGPATSNCAAIACDPHPQVIECTVNAMYSNRPFAPDDESPHIVIDTAKSRAIGVMGVRAVQRGALTDKLDRTLPVDNRAVIDFARANGFRELASRMGWSASYLANRYAVSVPNVDTIVLGVKNRSELAECIRASEDGPLDSELLVEVEDSFSR